MPSPVLAIAAAGGAVALLAGKSSASPAATPAKAASGATKVSPRAKIAAAMGATNAGVKPPTTLARAGSFNNYREGGAQPSDIEAKVAAKAKAEFDKLSDAAKKKACQELKAAYPNSASIQAVDCSKPSYVNVMKAIAAAGGTAACAATGAGTVVSPLCGMAAAWIAGWAGPKLKEWAGDAYDAVSETVSDAAGKVASKAKDVAEDVYDALTPW